MSGSRYFISYSHRAAEDGQLAEFLRGGLESAGHVVFIDRGMRVGTDWVKEIAERIDWCDYLVVLLSEASIHSEMVLGEVRMAHRKRRKNGKPHILPVRVRYDGPLDYELDSYLARVQYVRWASAADGPHVLQEIVGAASPGAAVELAEAPVIFEPAPPADSRGRPPPSEDPRQLFASPGGTCKIDDEFYIRRPADELIDAAARRLGETVIIKAPRQLGKSSLLIRYLNKGSEAGKRFAFVDFQGFTNVELESHATLLSRLARQILRSFRLESRSTTGIETNSDLTNLIEDEVITKVDSPITLAFDEADRILGRPYQGDFFSMLRLWHNRRAEPNSRWENVDLALVIATEPYLLIDSKDRSPFNVTDPIEPRPFIRPHLDDLNVRYGELLDSNELDDLFELLSGHPYLTRLAFHRIATHRSPSFDDVHTRAAEPDGPFGDHLRAMLVLLQQQKGLLPAMRQVVANGSVPDDETYYRLHGAGLVCHQPRRVVPANMLYARFFRDLG